MTGSAVESSVWMVGALAAAGSLLRTALTWRSTSTDTSFGSAWVVNWMVTTDTPGLEVEVIWSTLLMEATASWMGLVTCVSIVAGSAPRSVVVTTTVGMVTLGTMLMLKVR